MKKKTIQKKIIQKNANEQKKNSSTMNEKKKKNRDLTINYNKPERRKILKSKERMMKSQRIE